MSQLKLLEDAIYLPAVSEAYARHDVSKPFPRPLHIEPADLDFFDLGNGLFHYPYGLYSAGQAAKSANSINKISMLSGRDRQRTIVLADSGGYQIQQGTIPFKGTATTLRMLRWMEKNGDFSMVLDFPTGGVSRGAMTKHRKRLEAEGHNIVGMNAGNQLGLDFNACLKQTCINNDFMQANRVPGATKLLNVLQGRNESESQHWYQAVKHYPFEGWSFAGGHQSSFSMTLNRVFDMDRDGLWPATEWLHFLGTSKLWAGALLSTLQRGLRARFNPLLQVSFDSSSPFLAASQAVISTGYILDRFGWAFTQDNIHEATDTERSLTLNEWAKTRPQSKDGRFPVQHEDLFKQRSWTPSHTAIGDKVLVGDLFEPGAPNTLGELGVRLLMNHNTQVFVHGFEVANELFTDRNLDFIPMEYFKIKTLIEHAFEHNPNRSQFLLEAKPHLDKLAHL